jgi:transaldolase
MGKAAIANAKVVYQRFLEIFHGASFAPLQAAGAARQRLLWASTSTKNPAYPDTMYIDELIGPETVNTMPPATIDAFRDHGVLADQLLSDADKAQQQLADLARLNIDLAAITDQLQVEGVDSFAKAFAELMATIESKQKQLAAG